MYADKFGSFFGRLNEDGNVCVFHDNGERATRLDADVYPVGSEFSVKYEHSLGITITKQDADKIGIEIE